MGKVATLPLPSRGAPPLESGGLNQKWLHNPCRLGEPLRFRAGGKIRSGPEVGKVATLPLPSRGAPPLESGGLNQKWLHNPCRLGEPLRIRVGGTTRSGQGGNITFLCFSAIFEFSTKF